MLVCVRLHNHMFSLARQTNTASSRYGWPTVPPLSPLLPTCCFLFPSAHHLVKAYIRFYILIITRLFYHPHSFRSVESAYVTLYDPKNILTENYSCLCFEILHTIYYTFKVKESVKDIFNRNCLHRNFYILSKMYCMWNFCESKSRKAV